MQQTKIDYLDVSWNPLAMRCTPISEGCAHCWHIRMCNRLAGNPKFSDDVRAAYAGDSEPVLIQERLEAPLRRRKPARIGVQFMGDLFHKDVPFEWTSRIFSVMERSPRHTFIVLTKRPDRMLEFVRDYSLWESPSGETGNYDLDNIWLGITAENQQRADERIPLLLQCPAAVRFVSIEPMLGPVDLSHWLTCACEEYWPGQDHHPECPTQRLNWTILGGETGPGARPTRPDWARQVRDQCIAAGVPFFFKTWNPRKVPIFQDAANPHLLDGREWHQWPEVGR